MRSVIFWIEYGLEYPRRWAVYRRWYAEFERNLIRERTNAGLSAARARGRKGGRPKTLDEKKRKLAVQLYRDRKHPIDAICQMMAITKPTLYRYVQEAA